ncbi:MAG: SCO family protein [Burkholderiaceae bacterium]|nr:SCO family protein [Burkholderiaceae bacterium]
MDRERRRHLALLALGLVATAGGAALLMRGLRRSGPGEPPGPAAGMRSVTVLHDEPPLPAFRLDSPGGPLTRDDLRGRWTFLFFGYTQCPDVCPTALGLMAELCRRLPAVERPAVLFVSVDPARDTPELLAQYVPAFDPAFRGASGDDAALAALVRHLGVQYHRHPPGRPEHPMVYTVDHSAGMFLLDPAVRLRGVFSPPHDLEAMLADYRQLVSV